VRLSRPGLGWRSRPPRLRASPTALFAMNDDGKEGPGAPPLDRARWEENLTRWQQAEAQFAQDPAEGLRVAERLLIELSGVSGGSPTRVVREFTWKREYPSGSVMPGTDPNPLARHSRISGAASASPCGWCSRRKLRRAV